MYRSLQSVTEDSQSWGCGRTYPDNTASTITNRHEKKANNPLSARCSSVSCAGISVQICNNHCLLSPFALSTFPTITQRLCCSGSATGIVFGMYVTDPILNFVATERYVCTRRYTASSSATTGSSSSSSMQSVLLPPPAGRTAAVLIYSSS